MLERLSGKGKKFFMEKTCLEMRQDLLFALLDISDEPAKTTLDTFDKI